MSFRGINTTVIQIRRQVFTEVARMAYANVKGEKANHLMRKIPYTIIPGEEGKLRKDIFLERAIVEERVRLAMGLPTRRMDEYNSVVSGLEDASIADKYYDPPLVNVIKFACNRCPEKLVKVSDLCQGCLAHPCMEVCPKKAITWESGRSIIGVDGTHAAGRSAGALGLDDGVVGADGDAAAALDALVLIDGGTAALPSDGLLGAHFHTGVCKAALTQVRHLDQLFGAAVAGKLDHVDQRGIVVLIGDGGVLQTGDHAVVLVHAAGGQTHSQTHALLNDGALQEDVLAQLALLTGDDGIGDLAHQVVGLLALDVGVSHAGDLGKHLTADLDDRSIDSSETHSNLSLLRNSQKTEPPALCAEHKNGTIRARMVPCWLLTARRTR
jgi:ferredoxin